MSKEQEIALKKLDRFGLLSRKNYLNFSIIRYVIDTQCNINRVKEIAYTNEEIAKIDNLLEQKKGNE